MLNRVFGTGDNDVQDNMSSTRIRDGKDRSMGEPLRVTAWRVCLDRLLPNVRRMIARES